MIRRAKTIGFWRGRLPHWEVEDGRYFVTVHLAGAIPMQGQIRIHRQSQELHNRSDCDSSESSLPLMRTIFGEMERWLDKATLSTLLFDAKVASMVMESIDHRIKTEIWDVYDFVIMPSHIHLFLSVLQATLKETMEDFKRWTGHQASKLTTLPHGRFWQDEWFDHWSRSDEQDERIMAYILRNPVAAGLVPSAEDWRWRK